MKQASSKVSPRNGGEVADAETTFRFGHFLLDRELRRDGHIIKLPPRVLGLLRALVRRHGQLVSKQELWEEVWHGTIVTDAAMSVCVSELRRALGDEPRRPTFVTTLHRRGYRFSCPVVEEPRAAVVGVPARGEPAMVEHRRVDAGDERGVSAARLALHYERVQDFQAAAAYCLTAGRLAVARSAYDEAEVILEHGLGLLADDRATEPPWRAGMELDLRLELAPARAMLRGSASDGACEDYRRAWHLAVASERPREAFRAAFGLRSVALARGELRRAHRYGALLLARAQRAGDPGLESEAWAARGNTAFQLGALEVAEAALRRALALHDPQREASGAVAFGMDQAMFADALLAIIAGLRGGAAEAVRRIARVLVTAADTPNAYERATAHNFAAWLAQVRNDPADALHHATVAAEVANRHRLASAQALAWVRGGWARAALGDGERGTEDVRKGIRAWRAADLTLGLPHFYLLLADAELRTGAPVAAEAALGCAEEVMRRSGERWVEPEAWQLRAACCDALGGSSTRVAEYAARAVAAATGQGRHCPPPAAASPRGRRTGPQG